MSEKIPAPSTASASGVSGISGVQPAPRTQAPAFRRLRVYAFDPSLATQLENAVINQVTVKVPWESGLAREPGEKGDGELQPGPVGEYLEVIDIDPASGCFYPPVDLNDRNLLAQDGLSPSEGNPQFHQQMVYAVAMTTIRNFERALGRLALWSPHYERSAAGVWVPHFVRRLRIYPHALRQANAYYSPQKKALLFGYFPAQPADAAYQMPGAAVFTCLSHDIVVHETTHALLDGLHRRFIEPSNPDSLAFHEAFSDIVALLQHFSFPDVLNHQIAKTRGDLGRQNLLGELACEFGRATGARGALRSAIGSVGADGRWQPHQPRPGEYQETTQPHARGSHLVAAVFDGFLSIYKSRIADLLRIATGGTGRLPEGELHPDLVHRLAEAAGKSAQHVLTMCLRALDYCPPVDLTFGEYLRALITADYDLVRDDDRGYRIAMIEAFRRRGIFPAGVRTLSEDSLRWYAPAEPEQDLLRTILPSPREFRDLVPHWDLARERRLVFQDLLRFQRRIQDHLRARLAAGSREAFQVLGLDALLPARTLTVDAIRPARRIGPDGQSVVEMIVEITQRLPGFFRPPGAAEQDPEEEVFYRGAGFVVLRQLDRTRYDRIRYPDADFWVRGGAAVLFDPETARVRYVLGKNIRNPARAERQVRFLAQSRGRSLRATYFGAAGRMEESEAFALLHRGGPEEAPDA